jgi:hypothetical protein
MKTRRRPSNSVSTIPKVTQPSVIPKESSFGSMVKQGFGWGLGNSLAHRLINTVSDKPIVSEPVSTQLTYKQCMLDFDDEAACKQYLK